LKQQDYPKDRYEIIVVDNNSKDKTAEVIKRQQVIYLLEDEIQTSYAARNTGYKDS
jgi:glycosyltransferase involved in cell wall biosynthesis